MFVRIRFFWSWLKRELRVSVVLKRRFFSKCESLAESLKSEGRNVQISAGLGDGGQVKGTREVIKEIRDELQMAEAIAWLTIAFL
ncbi:hypothetical protein H6F89_11380 [Cyanobacteria bacterium FACHB-63]|nr:hypothetical protein [Cyanobacteria bacterium FACHB-63]